jgi:hypothetical protein
VITEDKVKPDPKKKVLAIENIPTLTTVKHLKAFLGMAG